MRINYLFIFKKKCKRVVYIYIYISIRLLYFKAATLLKIEEKKRIEFERKR